MGNISDKKVLELQVKANEIRKSIIKMLVEAQSGHTGGSLGMTDIFTYLFFYGMEIDPDKPDWDDRDRFILSNGHIAPVLYATMAHRGFFPIEELMTLRKFGSRLQGHPHREFLPGIETSSGPLGSGISQALGMALADRIDSGKQSNKFFYCCVGDGDLQEGQNWEAILNAGKYKPHNLILIIDRNNIQIDGYTEDVMPLNPLADKFKAFNFHVQEIDGHNFEAIDNAINEAKAVFDLPSVIIANTIPGKGVKEFERLPIWHGKAPTKAEGEMALKQLEENFK
jgi:transketolase